ncbi:hypothetical protein CGRA01v4_06430 [Colletotrichum graminicola]|uniref:Uncharacterized protein n=1 Tax=Colletotrichum graminicola (strain M1.001 / M2 / FGSC 10212) TaxID=645133 RepID=E3Q2C3_COLGM|nr:uncharacterized protein GLRG_00368 [Colletotrichum graminicola M1.001]EFQ25224.1 hypothetical protein GLRG_00368 [Colletotrichum graminicola M1.001]WDK15149.1 hypothetical protein CGRA01v4_06430 [Colletotrichum graminicola]
MAPQHVAKPTFFLSDLSTTRNGHIVLGNIFNGPFQVEDKVAGPLSKVKPGDIPASATQSVTETGLYLRETHASSWGANLLAKFLSVLHLSVGTDHGRDLEVVYEVDHLETVTLSGVGSYIRQRIARPSEAALQKELMGFGPSVYMITGIKYATGLKVWTVAGNSTEGGAGLGGALSPDASASASGGVHGSSAASRMLQRSVPGEIVLAYQLTKITPKNIKTVGATFLSDGGGNTPTIHVEVEGGLGLRGICEAAVEVGLEPDSDFGVNSVRAENGKHAHDYSRVVLLEEDD